MIRAIASQIRSGEAVMADSVSNRYVTNKDSSPSRSLQQGCDRIIHDTQRCVNYRKASAER